MIPQNPSTHLIVFVAMTKFRARFIERIQRLAIPQYWKLVVYPLIIDFIQWNFSRWFQPLRRSTETQNQDIDNLFRFFSH